MKKITLRKLLFFLITCSWVNAQEAKLQIIHNSPDLAAQEVDIYINGVLELNNFAFRTATEFLPVPAGVDLRIDVSDRNSTSSANSLYNVTINLDPDVTYLAIANGIVSPSGYSVAQNFAINLYENAREFGQGIGTDVLVNHGSPDAPMVDIFETSNIPTEIVPNLSYPQFAGYLELPTADYVLDVRAQNGTTVASYLAPLETLQLLGQPITVLASGFLNPAINSNGPSFGLWVATAAGGALIPLPTATARVQVIHNSPDLAAAQVDVYINGALELDNFAFRTATPFIDLPSGVTTSIDIKAPNSNGNPSSPVLYNLTTALQANRTYILVANGIISPTGYSVAPNFAINVFDQGREEAEDSSNTDVLVNHGSPDAPTVDIFESSATPAEIVPNLSFPQFAGYLELPTADYVLDVKAQNGTTVASFAAPLGTLQLGGEALTVLASGFLNPAVNSNGPGFGLWVATAAGGALIPLPTATARVQVIHNSPDLAASQVDVYINGTLSLDNFAFRTATNFIDLPSGINTSIDIKASNSNGNPSSPVLYNLTTALQANRTYILVANGIISATGYSVAPNFAINVFAQGREEAENPSNTDVLVNHGSPDAPMVDIFETSVSPVEIVPNLSFPQFAGYLELPAADYVLTVRTQAGETVASFQAPLQTLALAGEALTVLASGFLSPEDNSNGPSFGLWVARSIEGGLIELPVVPLSNQTFTTDNITVYPNPAKGNITIQSPESFQMDSVKIIDVNGRIVETFLNPSNTIDVSKISDGMYLMQIEQNDMVVNKKIIVRN